MALHDIQGLGSDMSCIYYISDDETTNDNGEYCHAA